MGWKGIWARLAPKVISLSTSMEGTSPYIAEKSDAISSGDKDALRNIQDKEGSLARKAAAAQLGLAVVPQILPVIANPATASTTAGAVAATGLDAAGLVGGLSQLNNYWNNRKNLTWNDAPGIILSGLSLVPGSSQITNVKNWGTAANTLRTYRDMSKLMLTPQYFKALPKNTKSLIETYTNKNGLQKIVDDTYDTIGSRASQMVKSAGDSVTDVGLQVGLPENSILFSPKFGTVKVDFTNNNAAEFLNTKPISKRVNYIFNELSPDVNMAEATADGITVNRAHFLFPFKDSQGNWQMLNAGQYKGTAKSILGHEAGHVGMYQISPIVNQNWFKLNADGTINANNKLFQNGDFGELVAKSGHHDGLPEEYLSDYFGELAGRGLPQSTAYNTLSQDVQQSIINAISSRRNLSPEATKNLLENLSNYGYIGTSRPAVVKYPGSTMGKLYEAPTIGNLSIIPEDGFMSTKQVIPGSRPISDAERLGIPKSMRSNPKALEDPYYWGYRQWNQRYNAAVESGNMKEAQRLRDLHFKIKTPDNKIVDYKGNPHKVYHGSPEDWYIFDDSKRGIDDVIYFSTDKAYADQYTIPRSQWQNGMIPTKSSREFYLYGKEPINVGSDMYYGSVQDELIHNWANGLNADSVYGLDAITNPLNQSSGVEFGVLRRNQFKLTKPITKTNTGEIIPIVKRDNFRNSDIRYKQGGIIKGQNSMKIPESATSKAYFSGLKDYLFHTTKSFIPSKYRPTKGNDIKTQYYTRPELKEEVALSIFGGTDKNAKGILGDRNYFYKDFDDAYNQIINTSTNLEPRVASNGTLGNYMISAGEDNGRRYLSFIDKFDHVIIPGKPIPIYDRIYEDEIDSLYNKNRSAFNEGDWITRSPILNKLKKKNRIIKGQNGFLNTWQKAYNSKLGKGLRNFLNGADSDLSDEEYLEKHGYNKPVGSIGILGALVAPEWEGLESLPVAENFGRTGTVKAVPKTAQMISTKIKNFEGIPQVSKVEPVKELTKFEKFLQRPIKEQDDIVRFWNGEKFSNMEMLKLDKKAYQQFKNWINK